MKRASELFGEADRRAVAEAVARAEATTSGEIVPVVATASGRYDRAEDLFGLLVALIALATTWVAGQEVVAADGDWATGATFAIGLPTLLVVVFSAFFVGAALAARVPALRAPFVPRREMEQEVERGAAAAFHRFGVRGTRAATGVLVYVSLFERMVRVEGDGAIVEKLTEADWRDVCDRVVAGLRAGQPTEGFVAGIERAGELLAREFPRDADDLEELPNELRLLD